MTAAIGIDVGGTKIAAGLIELPEGAILVTRVEPTPLDRCGTALLESILAIAQSLLEAANGVSNPPRALGVGIAELVDRSGAILSAATFSIRGVPLAAALQSRTSLPAWVEADVRAAAAGEAALGHGRGMDCALFVTIGTGISASLVLAGKPFLGTRGLTGTFASSPSLAVTADGKLEPSPPLEAFASGPAIASRFAAIQPGFSGTAREVVALADQGDSKAMGVVCSAGRALGAAIANLVNTLDPQLVILGGGLGLAGGCFRDAVAQAVKEFVWSEFHRDIPLVSSRLGTDAGWIGAAVVALEHASPRLPC